MRGMYLFFSLILSPVLFPMQVVRTLALVFAVLLAVRLLHSKCKDRRMLPVCLQDTVKAGRSALCGLVRVSSRLRVVFSSPHGITNARRASLLGGFCVPAQRNEVRREQPSARCIWKFDAIPG